MHYRYRKAASIAVLALFPLMFTTSGYAVSVEFLGLSKADEGDYVGRVTIRIDDPSVPNDPGPSVDVGATSFTIEFWMRSTSASIHTVSCDDYGWIEGNIIIDRDRYYRPGTYGISITETGSIAFGLRNGSGDEETVCGNVNVADDFWHHVALQWNSGTGLMEIYVDGSLDNSKAGPSGNISYPDDGTPGVYCGPGQNQACTNSDPFIVIGTEKHDADVILFPPYVGKMDELRFSNVLRYNGTYTVRTSGFPVDGDTVALYRFEEGSAGTNCTTGTQIVDAATGPENYGECQFGGTPQAGPVWSADTPFDPLPPGSSSSSSSSSSSGGSSGSGSSSSGSGGSSSSSSSSGGDDGGGGGVFHIGSIVLLLAAIFRRRSRVTDITSRHLDSFTM